MMQLEDTLQEAEPHAHPDQNIDDPTLETMNSCEIQGGMVVCLFLEFKKLSDDRILYTIYLYPRSEICE